MFEPDSIGSLPASPGGTQPAGAARRRLIAAALAFVVSALLASGFVWRAETTRTLHERTHVSELAGGHASAIRYNIERALSSAYAMAALVHQGNGSVRDFEATVERMLPYYPGVSALALAPGGVVTAIAPFAENRQALGHQLLKDPRRDKEVLRTLDSARLTLAGPFPLLQGGIGAAGRLPVYLAEPNGTKSFWGLVSVIIRFPETLESARLQTLVENGFDYELWRVHPDSGERHVIAGSTRDPLIDPVELGVPVPNADWTLSVAPRAGWTDSAALLSDIALALLFSLLMMALALTLTSLKEHQQGLESMVARRTAEAQLREEERNRAQSLAMIGSWAIDGVRGRMRWTSEAHRILGLPPDAAIDYPTFLARVHPDDRAAVDDAWRGGDDGRHDIRHRIVVDGATRWLHSLGDVRFADDGSPVRGVGTIQDITERKQADDELRGAKAEAERANDAKSRFLAAASHDLRQPLSALSLYVDILARRVAAADRPLVGNMKNCVGSLSDLLTDLLDLSKLDAGVVKANTTDFALDEVMRHLVSVHAPDAQSRGLRLRCARSSLIACSDAVLLRRILGNLLSNALRYTEHGGVVIGCRRRGGKHWVEVWDSGIGIPADKTSEIFEEFKQLDETRNRGSGLGLAIVARTAALLGLEVRVESRLGRGSMFAIEVPVGTRPASVVPNAAIPDRPLRIALVEDNIEVGHALEYALREVGHEVIVATNGRDIGKGLEQRRPDLVISDYRLGDGETGFRVIRALRSAFGEDLPALLITGDTNPQLLRSMTSHGIMVQHKPIEIETLRACIAELAARRGLR